MTYGQVLDRLIEERNISKAELARRIGKSRSYISQLINGKVSEPSLSLAFAIADALDVDVNYFVELMKSDDGR